jgi:hypothetical protein
MKKDAILSASVQISSIEIVSKLAWIDLPTIERGRDAKRELLTICY